jgi:hypothetical protein
MSKHKLELILLPDLYAVCRLNKDAPFPAWDAANNFFSITRTSNELSLVYPQYVVPDDVLCERSWRCLKVVGTMDFSMVGVLAALVTPLAEAEVPVFVVSTFDTDYLFVKENDLVKAMAGLRAAGHTVQK